MNGLAELSDSSPLVALLESSSLLLPNPNGNPSEAADLIEALEKSSPSSEFRTRVGKSRTIAPPNAENQLPNDTEMTDEKQDSEESLSGSRSRSRSRSVSESESGFSNWFQAGEPMKTIPSGVGAGLLNLGNTCFINAILQCFTHTVPLVELLCSCNHPGPCSCGNEEFCVIRNLRGHIKLALSCSGTCICPSTFVDNVKYFSSYFQRYCQEDAHEFLQSFLDKFEKCCLDPSNKNVVEQVFGGRLISRLRCCDCGSCSITHEASVGLSLEIEDVDDLRSALTSFTQMEKLEDEFTCDNCNKKVSKEKQLMLDQAPRVVTFHLKRFKNDGICIKKIHKHVGFPLELNLEPFTVTGQSDDVGLIYHLYAVVEHIGTSLTSGHYFSYIRSSPNTWHKLDDSLVTRVQECDVLSQDAYILFYAREGTPWFSSIFHLSKQLSDTNASSSSPQSVLDTACGECVSDHTDISKHNLLNLTEVPITGFDAYGTGDFDSDCDPWNFDSDFRGILSTFEPEKVHNVSEDMETQCSTSSKSKINWCQDDDDDTSVMPNSNVSSFTEGLLITDQSPGRNQEGSFQIPVGDMKSENQQAEASCTKSSAGHNVPEPLLIGIALQYLEKNASSSRAELLSAAMGCSSPVKRTKSQGKSSPGKKTRGSDTHCQP